MQKKANIFCLQRKKSLVHTQITITLFLPCSCLANEGVNQFCTNLLFMSHTGSRTNSSFTYAKQQFIIKYQSLLATSDCANPDIISVY